MDVAGSLRSVKERIGEAAARAGRPAGDIKLVRVARIEARRDRALCAAGHGGLAAFVGSAWTSPGTARRKAGD